MVSALKDPSDDPLDYSVRRRHVDEFFLGAAAGLAPGSRVLDLGGNKVRKRGAFDIGAFDLRVVSCNLSTAKRPDVRADAAAVPFQDACFDAVLCSELLEHVPSPPAVLREAHRVLRKGGLLLACAPFLFRIHADPSDYGRYTDSYWRESLARAGFRDVSVEPQGLYFSVLAEMLRSLAYEYSKRGKPASGILRGLVHGLVAWGRGRAASWDRKPGVRSSEFYRSFTTGFAMRAVKA